MDISVGGKLSFSEEARQLTRLVCNKRGKSFPASTLSRKQYSDRPAIAKTTWVRSSWSELKETALKQVENTMFPENKPIIKQQKLTRINLSLTLLQVRSNKLEFESGDTLETLLYWLEGWSFDQVFDVWQGFFFQKSLSSAVCHFNRGLFLSDSPPLDELGCVFANQWTAVLGVCKWVNCCARGLQISELLCVFKWVVFVLLFCRQYFRQKSQFVGFDLGRWTQRYANSFFARFQFLFGVFKPRPVALLISRPRLTRVPAFGILFFFWFGKRRVLLFPYFTKKACETRPKHSKQIGFASSPVLRDHLRVGYVVCCRGWGVVGVGVL